MNRISAMFFAAHVNVATFAQDEERQSGKGHKSNGYFPHAVVSKKKDSRPWDESL